MGISPQQFAQLQQRVAAPRRRAAPVNEPIAATRPKAHHIILGIDPSLRGTGYGIIRQARTRLEALAQGTVKCPPAWERTRCLALIAQSLRDVIRAHGPTVCVVEGLFYAQNLQTALIMGEARGAGLAAVAEAGLEVYELAPRRVKQAIVGYGAAQKTAVAKMVQRMLSLAEQPQADAADALALALAFTQETSRFSASPPKRV